MDTGFDDGGDARALADSLCGEWERLCAEHLPLALEGLFWRCSRGRAPGDIEQGWKLHVSATVLTASDTLRRVAPLLRARGARFKAPSSLRGLQQLNCGLIYGYSQIGKFITVYPRSEEEAVSLARRLHRLTRGMSAPTVPFDRRLAPGSCVYYRYGSFTGMEMENADGTRTPAMRDPAGRLVADLRVAAEARPDWVSDPFVAPRAGRKAARAESPLATTFRAFQALTQRGKGGVYKALDLSAYPPRFCILKEGRACGELAWDGRDGRRRVRHEEAVLASLRSAGVPVPSVYSSFEAEGNHYLVTEYVEGQTLHSLLSKRRRRLRLSAALGYGARLSALLSRIHAAGWAWLDCKPGNVIVTSGGVLRPLDFEGACAAGRPDPFPWSTTAFTPPPHPDVTTSGAHDDLYALGAVIYLLVTGRLPEPRALAPVEKLRRGVPVRVRRVVAELLDADPRNRPGASVVAEELNSALTA
ncbi:MAG TPA: phosphotransferase [Pyrinomonadaceae bacterium]|jgi:hypothetical protein